MEFKEMALFINTNISSLYAQRAAQRANDSLDVSYQRLSSGLRINKAKDDAAGIQVVNNLTTQLDGLTQGNRNTQDALAFCQTIEGALDEVTNMLQRIRTLAVQSANGTNTEQDRKALQVEVDALADEIQRIAEDTTFAGADVLNGRAGISTFQLGADPSSIVKIDLTQAMDVTGIAKLAAKYSGSDEFAYDVDGNGQIGQNEKLKYSDLFKNNGADSGIKISTAKEAEHTLAGIDGMINAINRKRAELGALQNRFEATVRNQDSIKENVASSRATIRDTDFAEETANLTQQNIIQQATATILTQANQRPQVALNLLNR